MESLLQVTEIFPASCNAVSKQATLNETRTNIHMFQVHLSLFMAHPFIYATAIDICSTQL